MGRPAADPACFPSPGPGTGRRIRGAAVVVTATGVQWRGEVQPRPGRHGLQGKGAPAVGARVGGREGEDAVGWREREVEEEGTAGASTTRAGRGLQG